MEEKVVHYDHQKLRVIWKPKTCIHSEKCWRGLPEVFKPKERKWIQIEGTDHQKLMDQIGHCPSGALSYEVIGEQQAEKDTETIQVQVFENGPLMVNGPIEVLGKDGTTESKAKAAFCRCGASANKPYCDGSHNKIDFKG